MAKSVGNVLYQINNVVCDDDGSKLTSVTDKYVAELEYPTFPSGRPLTIDVKKDASIAKINLVKHG